MLFEREDWKLFRNMETLPQKAGVPKSKLSMLVCKELADWIHAAAVKSVMRAVFSMSRIAGPAWIQRLAFTFLKKVMILEILSGI
ncbi:MAG: hypothetical protein JL57_18775 [Desulfosporosinus sp. BICA1-9]|nr:MAG: hypothetical protein JL57_18775 [Desulfosporosinus sp. BICA1-9]